MELSTKYYLEDIKRNCSLFKIYIFNSRSGVYSPVSFLMVYNSIILAVLCIRKNYEYNHYPYWLP